MGSGPHGARAQGSADAGILRHAIRLAAKEDATDAEAICESVARPTMPFVPVKSEEQQSVLMLHRVRELLIRQRRLRPSTTTPHQALPGLIANPRACLALFFTEQGWISLTPGVPNRKSTLMSFVRK